MSIVAELAKEHEIAKAVDCPGCKVSTGVHCKPNHPKVGPCLGRLWLAKETEEMAGARGRGRPPKVNTQAEQLTTALDFVSSACGQHEFWHEHIRFGEGYVVAFNGQLAAGHPVVEELSCCPHLEKLKTAIAKCGKSLAITETPGGKLSIKGDKLNALVPCLPTEELPFTGPDQQVAVIGDVFKEAFRVCGALASEAATDVLAASLLLEANVCTGTNRHALLQFWHGVNLPPNMVLPKAFAQAIAKQSKAIVGFGFRWYSENDYTKVGRVTFHFEGGAWISTVCYADNWPNFSRAIGDGLPSSPIAPPAGLFEGMEAVAGFNDNGYVTFAEGKVQSHRSDLEGAQYDVPGLQGGSQFDSKLFLKVAPHIKTLDYTTHSDKALFFGGEPSNPIRGAIAGIVENSHGEREEDQPRAHEDSED